MARPCSAGRIAEAALVHGTVIQDPTVRKYKTLTITVPSPTLDAFAAELTQTTATVEAILAQYGLELPRGVRVIMTRRAEHVTLLQRAGLGSEQITPLLSVYNKSTEWVPTIYVLAEDLDNKKTLREILCFFANTLGGLVGATQTRDSVPVVCNQGISGLLEVEYRAVENGKPGKASLPEEVAAVQQSARSVAQQQPARQVREILIKVPVDDGSKRHAGMLLSILFHEVPMPKRKAALQAVLAWARSMTGAPSPEQVLRMEEDLVKALDVRGRVAKELDLDARMEKAKVDKKLRKAAGSILQAYYEARVEQFARACEAAKAKTPPAKDSPAKDVRR